MDKSLADNIAKYLIKAKIKDQNDLAKLKRQLAIKYKTSHLSNVDLLLAYQKYAKQNRTKISPTITKLLIKRPVRSLSGIVNVSVLTKPYGCPGKCIYCPTQKGMPKSYMKGEPAAQRAAQLKFDPYKQVWGRLEVLQKEGHKVDKIDLRIIGETWSYYPLKYREQFVAQCFKAANDFTNIKLQKSKIKNLEDEQRRNEVAKCRIIGIAIETRPDYITRQEILHLRKLGITKVELGIQSIYSDVLEKNKRGHGLEETITATKLLKEAGFKISYQMMPNLPGSNLARDKEMFLTLFSNPSFQPDYLKIYPLAVVKEALLYKQYKSGKFKSYSPQELENLIAEIKVNLPYYVRVERVIRDIPSQFVENASGKISNMRQIILEKLKAQNKRCNCIRCREVRADFDDKEKIFLFRQDYQASNGQEIFLSFENKERTKLFSMLRLRINFDAPLIPVLNNSAIVRELHTYGSQTAISQKNKKAPQHQGLGKKLLAEAQKIATKEFKLKKLSVISGIGARGYYKKLGYKLKDTYMVKDF